MTSLLAVAETGSFSRAAHALGFTQSAVSQHVAAIERTVGARLLTRRPTVAPTPAGREFLRHARQMLAHEQAARAAVRRLEDDDAHAPIAMAVTPATEHLLPVGHAVAAVRVRDLAGASAALASGDVDLALVDGLTAPGDPLPGAAADVETRVLAEAPLGVLLPADHLLAARDGLALADLADARWLATSRTVCATADLAAVARTTLRRGTAYDGAAATTVARLVRAGHGLAAVPLSGLAPNGLARVPLTAPRLVHRIEVRVHAASRAVARAVAMRV
ncbi:DNA-binding transcriptional LysR family regulator [Xylanimonas ulmi]|uniref:DNA-binding transcriptional LysR family regulator n=1 Tax=Xylanimonas ulmi TaxID=228973 RepID=A0A4Q7M0W9_9MICO|nr:DNA-binding transcriptional LysR family regulator [Xylanibacterium ulmi]